MLEVRTISYFGTIIIYRPKITGSRDPFDAPFDFFGVMSMISGLSIIGALMPNLKSVALALIRRYWHLAH